MRLVPRFKRGLLLHPNKKTEKPTRFQREHNRRTDNGRPRSTLTDRENGGENNQFIHPKVQSPRHNRAIFQTAYTRQDVQNPRDHHSLNTTHRHSTSRPIHLPSLQSRQNLLDRYQQDGTGKDSTKQKNRGNVAHRTTARPQQTKIIQMGTETRSQGCSRTKKRQRREGNKNQRADGERGPTHARHLAGPA